MRNDGAHLWRSPTSVAKWAGASTGSCASLLQKNIVRNNLCILSEKWQYTLKSQPSEKSAETTQLWICQRFFCTSKAHRIWASRLGSTALADVRTVWSCMVIPYGNPIQDPTESWYDGMVYGISYMEYPIWNILYGIIWNQKSILWNLGLFHRIYFSIPHIFWAKQKKS